MSKVIAILATLDTKAAEANLMREEIESLGGKALIIDIPAVGRARPVQLHRREGTDGQGSQPQYPDHLRAAGQDHLQ